MDEKACQEIRRVLCTQGPLTTPGPRSAPDPLRTYGPLHNAAMVDDGFQVGLTMQAGVLVAACLLGSCSAGIPVDATKAVLSDPARHDGKIIEMDVYPFDLAHDPERYVACLDRCSLTQAQRVVTRLAAKERGRYDGFTGSERVRVTVRVDAGCYQSGSVCLWDHGPLLLVEQ